MSTVAGWTWRLRAAAWSLLGTMLVVLTWYLVVMVEIMVVDLAGLIGMVVG